MSTAGIYIRSLTILLFFISGVIHPVLAQTCTSNLFLKSYAFPGYGSSGFMDTLPNTNIMWGGTKGEKLLIANSNSNGIPLWSKIYSCSPVIFLDNQASVTTDINGNYFACLDRTYIAMMDANGNPIIAKHLTIPFNVLDIRGIGVLPNNQKIVLAKDNSTYAGEGYVLISLSADLSTILWQKHFSGNLSTSFYLKISGNDIYVMGMKNGKGLLIKYNQLGNVLLKKEYQVDNNSTILTNIYPYLTGYIVTALYQGGEINNSIMLRLNSNFDITQSFRYVNVQQNSSMALAVEPEGDFYGLWCTGFGISKGLFYIGKYNEVLWHRRSIGNRGKKLLKTPAGFLFFHVENYFAVGTQSPMTEQVLTRTDGNGMIGNVSCNISTSPFELATISNTAGNSSIDSRDTSLVFLSNATVTASDNVVTIFTFCSSVGNCSSLEIIGNAANCSANDTLVYVGRRNQGCSTQVSWSLTGGNAYQQQRNDSTIAIHFLQSGTYQLIARLGQTCETINDTITIQVSVTGQIPPLNIGPPDTLVCTGNNIILNALKGYASYLWQDASIDSVFTVTEPGTYYVRVTDMCGGIQNDTIRVHNYSPENFLPDDTSLCTYSSIKLGVAPGYTNFLWSNNSTGESLTINQPGLYWLEIRDNNGCKGRDSINITSKQCLRGLFVPNAFTPNGDTRNDLFKPSLFGTVKKYEFIVYNMYGQTVFKTNNHVDGWDGRINGKMQNQGAFTWVCIYQLDNQILNTEHGSVLLIR